MMIHKLNISQFCRIFTISIMRNALLIASILIIAWSQSISPTLRVANPQILGTNEDALIMNGGVLNSQYDDMIFNELLSCRNGNLNIVDVTRGSTLIVAYDGISPLQQQNILISSSPNKEPRPFLSAVNGSHFEIQFNCSCGWKGQPCSAYRYFNKVQVSMPSDYVFSFLINCDPQNRHKQFEIGYLFIALINSAIIIGVAMHSHVWSIRIKQRPLRYVLVWKSFLIFSVVGIGLILFLYFFTYRDFWRAFAFIKYFGIFFSLPFIFLCFNECFYLIKRLRKPLLKIVRQCDTISGLLAIGTVILACFQDNWILYDIMAGCICVGSIKIFHFNSLKESYLAMTIMVITVSMVGAILHFLLPLSYNDYAGELSSPIFFEVPDLVNNLFKKCSWLPVLDVIIPGVTLSFLRVYDENKSSKWGGIYTVSGNITFVVSTILWIGIEIFDPYSFPFSIVTCPLLMLVIFVISWRRNDWNTLLYGQFEQGYDIIDLQALTQTRNSFSKLIPENAINSILANEGQDNVRSSILSN